MPKEFLNDLKGSSSDPPESPNMSWLSWRVNLDDGIPSPVFALSHVTITRNPFAVDFVAWLHPLQVPLSVHSLDSVDVPLLMIKIPEGVDYGTVAEKILEALPPERG